jgi:hypothetical protein
MVRYYSKLFFFKCLKGDNSERKSINTEYLDQIKFVSDLRLVGGFLQGYSSFLRHDITEILLKVVFPPPIKLTAMI